MIEDNMRFFYYICNFLSNITFNIDEIYIHKNKEINDDRLLILKCIMNNKSYIITRDQILLYGRNNR